MHTSWRPSELCSHDLLEHLLVQAQIGNHPLQPPVLLLELRQAPHLGYAQATVLLRPDAEGASGIPLRGQTSCTRAPVPTCFRVKAICSSENFDISMQFTTIFLGFYRKSWRTLKLKLS